MPATWIEENSQKHNLGHLLKTNKNCQAFYVYLGRTGFWVSFSTCFTAIAGVNRGPYRTFILPGLSAAFSLLASPFCNCVFHCLLTSCVPTWAPGLSPLGVPFSARPRNAYLFPCCIVGSVLSSARALWQSHLPRAFTFPLHLWCPFW